MDVNSVPVLISSSGSPPADDGRAHKIVRPTPRRPADMNSSGASSSPDTNEKLSDQDVEKLLKSNRQILNDNVAKVQRKASSTSVSSHTFTPINSLTKRSSAEGKEFSPTNYGKSEIKQIPERDVDVQLVTKKEEFPNGQDDNLVTHVVVDGTTASNGGNSFTVVSDAADSGYQILSTKEEEVERDPQLQGPVVVGKPDHPAVRQGRSSLVKYKAQGRHKPKRRSHGQRMPKYQGHKKHSHHESTEDNLTRNLENANRLTDVKNAIEQLKLRSSQENAYSSNGGNTTSSSYTTSGTEDSDDGEDGVYSRRDAIKALKSKGMNNTSSQQSISSSQGVGPTSTTSSSLPVLKEASNPHGRQDQFQNQPGSSCGRRNMHQIAEEAHNTTVTSADEFVWIDSYNRLVELQKFPWNHGDLCAVIAATKNGREVSSSSAANAFMLASVGHGLSQSNMDILPRLSYYLQRALVRIAREAQRLSKPIGKCGRQEICSALKIVLTPPLATSAVKACLRAAAMFTISYGDGETASQRQTKSSRAGLLLHVGKMHRWMCLVKVGRFVHEYAAIYLTASIESILEELLTKCFETNRKMGDGKLSATLLEQVVASSSDFWGLFQPYSHLSSCRTAAGLAIPSIIEELTNNSSSTITRPGGHASSMAGANCGGGIGTAGRNVQQALLTTCVGSVEELEELVSLVAPVLKKVWNHVGTSSHSGNDRGLQGSSSSPYRSMSQSSGICGIRTNLSWNPEAFRTLYHFVKCSQLEYVGQEGRSPIQELIYERPYMVLPPLMEWVRVSSAFAEHRLATYVDSDDVQQAARVLLPGMDHPIRPLDMMPTNLGMAAALDELEYVNLLKREMAFHMLQTGRRDLVPHAMQLLPSTEKLNASNTIGLTALQLAAIRGDCNVVRSLMETGAEVDGKSNVTHENRHWTPLTYAALAGHYKTAKLLLEKGNANVEGGAVNKELVEQTETPLMLAAASGSLRMVELLLSYGASPLFSTREGGGILGFNASSGCTSAISVAAAHGHKRIMNVLISYALANPTNLPPRSMGMGGYGAGSSASVPCRSANDRVMSLAEILAEGATDDSPHSGSPPSMGPTGTIKAKPKGSATDGGITSKFGSKSNVRKLQEAMYHACEATNLEVTLDLRNNIGVPWTLHTWLQTLNTANDNNLVPIINEILQDFVSQWMEEQTTHFAEFGLPLLFSIFKNSKTEGTVLLLADIFSACFGKASIDRIEIPKTPEQNPQQPRIDPKFINNPELSDVQFRVEGKTFYAHKLVLVTASSRFASMLSSRFCEGTPPVLQINDIRYEIFHLVMIYLYNGGARSLQQVEAGDVLELMAAANFFQLPGLLRYCESRCSHLVDLDNIVSYYIHAKVYNATQLLSYCEGFLLQNMVALLTYDDSVKRLLFGKKLQNHDVLLGLLSTLQTRLKK